jgi:hypothetical protein
VDDVTGAHPLNVVAVESLPLSEEIPGLLRLSNGLIAFGQATDPDDLAAVRAQLPTMPTRRKRLVVLDEGHGVELLQETGSTKLSPLAGKVLDWVRGG